MQTTTQFSVFLINKPGILAQIVSAIAEAKVNLIALTIVDSQEHGVLRLVGDNHEKLRAVLQALNLSVLETEVLTLELPNRPGSLASVLATLARAHVNIQYAYVTAGTPTGRTTGILKVDNLIKASKVLGDRPKRDAKRSTVKKHAGRQPRYG